MAKVKSEKRFRISLFITAQEFDQLHEAYDRSMCYAFREYLHRRVFSEPIINSFRNRSLDAFVEEIIQYRNAILDIAEKSAPAEEELILNNMKKIKSTVDKILLLWSQLSAIPETPGKP